MEENKSNWTGGIIGFLIVIAIIWFFSGAGEYEGENAEYWFNAYDEAEARVEELESRVSDYETALQEANNNIEQANSMISEVQYADNVYDLRDAIDSLSTVDTVSEP